MVVGGFSFYISVLVQWKYECWFSVSPFLSHFGLPFTAFHFYTFFVIFLLLFPSHVHWSISSLYLYISPVTLFHFPFFTPPFLLLTFCLFNSFIYFILCMAHGAITIMNKIITDEIKITLINLSSRNFWVLTLTSILSSKFWQNNLKMRHKWYLICRYGFKKLVHGVHIS